MSEEKNILDQAKEMLGDKLGDGGIMEAAKSMLGDKAGEMLAGNDELKKKATEFVQKITPDSLDGKAAEMVDQAFDALKDMLGNKDEK